MKKKNHDMGLSSAHSESFSVVEVPQKMALVILHGDAAPGRTGGMDAAPIPSNALATAAFLIDGSVFTVVHSEVSVS